MTCCHCQYRLLFHRQFRSHPTCPLMDMERMCRDYKTGRKKKQKPKVLFHVSSLSTLRTCSFCVTRHTLQMFSEFTVGLRSRETADRSAPPVPSGGLLVFSWHLSFCRGTQTIRKCSNIFTDFASHSYKSE